MTVINMPNKCCWWSTFIRLKHSLAFVTHLNNSILQLFSFLWTDSLYSQKHILWITPQKTNYFVLWQVWIYTTIYCMFTFNNCGWCWVTVLLDVKKKWTKKGYFSPLCQQLAASHACTINVQLIDDDHFYLSKFKIGSYPWNKQLFLEPPGSIALMFKNVVDQCWEEVVHIWTVGTTAGTQLWKLNYWNQSRGFNAGYLRGIWCIK